MEARGRVLQEADLRAESPLLDSAFRTTSAWSARRRTTVAPTAPRTRRSLKLRADSVQLDTWETSRRRAGRSRTSTANPDPNLQQRDMEKVATAGRMDKNLMDESHEDPGNVSDSSASSCGSGAHMKAMVASGESCTAVFGCRLAGPDGFQIAKKTATPKKCCDSYSTNFSSKYEALDELDAQLVQAVSALGSRANKVSMRKSIKRDRVQRLDVRKRLVSTRRSSMSTSSQTPPLSPLYQMNHRRLPSWQSANQGITSSARANNGSWWTPVQARMAGCARSSSRILRPKIIRRTDQDHDV